MSEFRIVLAAMADAANMRYASTRYMKSYMKMVSRPNPVKRPDNVGTVQCTVL